MGIGENFLASDQMALRQVTDRFIYLEEDDLVEVTSAFVRVYDAAGQLVERETTCISEAMDVPDMGDFVNNVSRIFGANFGARFGVGEGSQLQAAAIGSAAFKKITSGLPVANQQRQAELMVLQPDLALAFLSKNPEIRRSAFHAFKERSVLMTSR